MASLAAVLSSSRTEPIDTITRMLAAAPHRGTTHEVIVRGRCVAGVARDDDDGHTGTAADGALAVAFSGRLDNLPDVAAAVRAAGAGDQIHTPAEVVLAAWRLWGKATAGRLRGSFSVIVTDGSRVWAFRDHFGNALLFFHEGPREFYAATEVKQVIAGAQIAREPDMEALERYFLVGKLSDRSASWFKGVRRVLIASMLVADERGVTSDPYWDPAPIIETIRPGADELAADFERLMSQAIERTLDGRTVISLSGGLDSATLAAFAAPIHLARANAPIAALSAVYPAWPTVDEGEYIRLITDALGIELHTYEPTANPFQGLREWAERLDGPVPRLIAIHEVAEYYQQARALGFRTILSGDFAESLNDSRAYLTHHLLHRGRLSAAARHLRSRRAGGASRGALVREAVAAVTPGFLERAYHRRTLRILQLMDWMDERVVKAMMAAEQAESWIPAGDRWRVSQLAPLGAIGVGYEAVETCQAYCGVRRREPWSDVDLFEHILSLPAETRFVTEDPRAKALLRRLLRGRLPDGIVNRVEKPRFGDYYTARVDYDVLRKWLVNPEHPIRGVRYDVVADHLERKDLSMRGFMWVRDLAAVHAFLSLW